MATTDTIGRVMVILSAAYPHFKGDEDTATVYAELLHDIDDGLLIAAAKAHATSERFFPSVAELRGKVVELQAQAQGIRPPADAWVNVQKAIRLYGWYGEPLSAGDGGGWRVPSTLSKLERKAVDGLGGWKDLCASENAPADRAHFLRIYEGLLKQEQQEAVMLPEIREAIAEIQDAERLKSLEAALDAMDDES